MVTLGACVYGALGNKPKAKEEPVCTQPAQTLPKSQTVILEKSCGSDLQHNASCVYVDPAANCLYMVAREGCYAQWKVVDMRCVSTQEAPAGEETL